VTSTGSALAVPDWPLSYGTLFPQMKGGVLFEHGHRMIAGAVAVCIFALAIWLHRRESRAWVRRLGVAAACLVILQAVLGGVTVLLRLPPAVSISHAGLAEAVFALTVAIAVVTSRAWTERAHEPSRALDASVRAASTFALCVVYAQIVLGAIVRHTGAGLVFPDFPLSGGRVIPPLSDAASLIQFAHRLGAGAVVITIVALAVLTHRRAREQPRLLMRTRLLVALMAAQVLLGASAVWTRLHPVVTVLHVACGALLLATCVSLVLWSRSRVSLDTLLARTTDGSPPEQARSRAAAGPAHAAFGTPRAR
jgi:cytochrome c oxidase assembly protein subunit 15